MKKAAVTAIGWIVSIALLASIAMQVDLGSVARGFASARWEWLVLAAAINMIVVAARALRWSCLMQPEVQVRYWPIFRATMIGFAGNNVLPARGGDWYKIYLLSRWSGASAPMLASVTGLDKLFDGLAILILFGVLSLFSPFPEWVRRGTVVVSLIVVVSLVICILLLLHHRRLSDDQMEAAGSISRIAKKLGSGMGALADVRLIVAILALSVAHYLLQVGTIWCCQMAFGQQLALWIPLLVLVAINLAIIVPSAPSGLGPFEFAAVMAYGWLGVGATSALGIALMYHAVQFLPVTLIGLIFYLQAHQILCITKDGDRGNAPPAVSPPRQEDVQ